MNQFLRPFLELTVILPGMFLAYLPVSSYLRQKPLKLTAWLFPLLLGLCISGGFLSCFFQISTLPVLFLLQLVASFSKTKIKRTGKYSQIQPFRHFRPCQDRTEKHAQQKSGSKNCHI